MGPPGTSNKIGRHLMTIESPAFLQWSAKISSSQTSSLGFLSFLEDYNSCGLCTGPPVKTLWNYVKDATSPHPTPPTHILFNVVWGCDNTRSWASLCCMKNTMLIIDDSTPNPFETIQVCMFRAVSSNESITWYSSKRTIFLRKGNTFGNQTFG